VEDAAQQPDGVRLVRLGQVVAAQDRPCHLGVPAAGAGGRGLRVEPQLRRGVAAGMFACVVAVDVRERGQGVLAGPSGQGRGDPVGELFQGEQGDPGLEVLGALDVGVQARDLDVEAPGECRDGHLVEADLVGEFGPGPGQAFGGQSYASHARSLFRQNRLWSCLIRLGKSVLVQGR
jgi:hypothetical protein